MDMDKQYFLVRILTVVVICHGFADGLIGLRPPNQTPHRDKKLPKPVSPKPNRIHYTQLHSPFQAPEKTHNYTVIETELREEDRCQTLALLRCSTHLLKQSLSNTTDVCTNINYFTKCIIDSLKDNGRREYITGIVLLDDLHYAAREALGCQGNDSTLSHMRHRISKRHGGSCCTEDVLNCGIQTFFKMTTNVHNRCHLVNFYDVCMNEISDTCRSNVLMTSYPVFVSQLKRQCSKQPLRRRKRSKQRQTIFFGT